MTQTIKLTGADGNFLAYLARPAKRYAAVVIVLHEIFGVNEDIRGMCDELAEHGFIAIAPDLFWRANKKLDLKSWNEAEAQAIHESYDLDKGVDDVQATVEAGRTISGSTGKVAVMGFAFGGLMAFLTALRGQVDAAVSYYGAGTESYLGELDAVSSPMLFHFAEGDAYIPRRAVTRITAACAQNPHVEICTYSGCDHAFARYMGEHYDADAAHLANGRTLAFLAKHLR